ncbi:MAG: ABC transporter permease, partial [Thermoproteus sp.]
MFETLGLVWSALWERRGRTIGAIIGVAIAFTALTFALSVGDYFKSSALSFFSQLGINDLFLVGSFTDADLATVRAYVAPYATAVVPISAAQASVRLPDGRLMAVTLYGVPRGDVDVLLPSAAIYDGSNQLGGGLAVVGYYVAFDQNTGAELLGVGYPLTLNYGGRSYNLVVSGIMAPEHPGVVNSLTSVIIDESQFRSITSLAGYQIVVVALKDTAYIDQVQSLLKAAFPNAEVISLTSLVQTVNQFFTGLELFLGL